MQYGKQFNPFGYFQGMFIPNCVTNSYLPDSSKLLLGRLFQYAGQNGKAYPFRKSLAKELHWTVGKLDRNIRALKDEKLLKTHQIDEDGPSTYIFLYHKIYDTPTVKNDSGGTVKNDSGGTVKNDKQKNEYIKNKKRKELSKDNSSDKSHKPRIKIVKSKNKLPKIVKKKSKDSAPNSNYKHTPTDLRNYNELKSHGITNHKSDTKAEIDSLDKLHALFSPNCKDPYHAVYIPEEFIDFKWGMDDLIEIFNFQLENCESYSMKPIKAIGKFILSEGFNGHKSWSPLLFWAQKMTKTAEGELTEDGDKLFKSMKRYKIDNLKNLESSIINKVADDLFSLTFNYTFMDGSERNMNYPFGVVDCLSKYIKNKTNRTNFKLVYITKKGFVNEFIETAVKQNQIKKKTSRRGVN